MPLNYTHGSCWLSEILMDDRNALYNAYNANHNTNGLVARTWLFNLNLLVLACRRQIGYEFCKMMLATWVSGESRWSSSWMLRPWWCGQGSSSVSIVARIRLCWDCCDLELSWPATGMVVGLSIGLWLGLFKAPKGSAEIEKESQTLTIPVFGIVALIHWAWQA